MEDIDATLSKAWWKERRKDLLQLASKETPLYVYNYPTLLDAVKKVKSITAVDRVFFAIKANPNPEILRLFEEQGLGFECVSPGEVEHIFFLFPNIDSKRILFTPNFAPKEEYEFGFQKNVLVTVDSTYALEHWGDIFKGKDIYLRFDPGKGEGHHKYVQTGGKASKFAISSSEVGKVAELVKQIQVRVVGLHAHLGSGILTPESWFQTASFLASLLQYFPDVKSIDAGGGLGVVEREDQKSLVCNQRKIQRFLMNLNKIINHSRIYQK